MVEKNSSRHKSTAKDRQHSRNAEQTRERILTTARRLFSLSSFENVRTREIAQAAGVDAALIKRYFGSKEGLFSEVIRSLNAGEAFTSFAQMKTHLSATLAEILEQGPLGESASNFRLFLSSALSPLVGHIVRDFFQKQCSWIEAGFVGDEGKTKADVVSAYIIGTLAVFHILHPRSASETDTRQVIAQFELLLDTLYRV